MLRTMFSIIEVQNAFFQVIMFYFAKHFVILHTRMCLTLVKIAKFNLDLYGDTDDSSFTRTASLYL